MPTKHISSEDDLQNTRKLAVLKLVCHYQQHTIHAENFFEINSPTSYDQNPDVLALIDLTQFLQD